jgi:hypothetical protein
MLVSTTLNNHLFLPTCCRPVPISREVPRRLHLGSFSPDAPMLAAGRRSGKVRINMYVVSETPLCTSIVWPHVKIINDEFGLKEGLMTTIHGMLILYFELVCVFRLHCLSHSSDQPGISLFLFYSCHCQRQTVDGPSQKDWRGHAYATTSSRRPPVLPRLLKGHSPNQRKVHWYVVPCPRHQRVCC